MARISWDIYFMNIALDIAKRSTCIRPGRQIGTVIVDENHRIISTGYNGNPRGMPHCEEIGCIREKLGIPSGEKAEICTAVHSEQNALLQAGPRAEGCTMYTIYNPCNTCAKMIVNAGIKRVVYMKDYPETMGLELLKNAGIVVERIDMNTSTL